MKRIAVMACVVLGLAMTAGQSHASWSELCYSGYQPWYNIFAKRDKCLTPEEERLQKFWHDYYDAMKHYYGPRPHRLGGLLQEPRLPDQRQLRRLRHVRSGLRSGQLRPGRRVPEHDVGHAQWSAQWTSLRPRLRLSRHGRHRAVVNFPVFRAAIELSFPLLIQPRPALFTTPASVRFVTPAFQVFPAFSSRLSGRIEPLIAVRPSRRSRMV